MNKFLHANENRCKSQRGITADLNDQLNYIHIREWTDLLAGLPSTSS